jgi:ABC-type nitrate/sulfonate/bicarbonate transport system substrate-binding protein
MSRACVRTVPRSSRFRRSGLVLVVVLAASLGLVACGGDDDTSSVGGARGASAAVPGSPCDASKAPAHLDTVKLQLDWTPNTNHTGFYVADRLGCYAQAGLKLQVVPYSDTSAETVLSAGQADFGVSFHSALVVQGAAGAPVVGVAAILQKTAEAIGVRADRADIATPKDLDGKVYAGFGGPAEVPILKAVIQAAGGTGDFQVVSLDASAYEAVYSGKADFTIPFTLWEGIQATLEHEPVKYFRYGDYGIPNQYSVMLETSASELADKPDVVRRFLAASRTGWEYAAQHPHEAAQMLIDANPGFFPNTDLVFQSASTMAEQGYLLDAAGHWGTIDPATFSTFGDFLVHAGVVADASGRTLTEPPDWSTLIAPTFLVD